jgi:hypothetical protein
MTLAAHLPAVEEVEMHRDDARVAGSVPVLGDVLVWARRIAARARDAR